MTHQQSAIAASRKPLAVIITLAALVALAALPWLVNGYLLLMATSVLIWIVGLLGLNLISGNAGLISLGYSGFLAVGAYANAILQIDLGLPAILAIPAAGVVAAILGLLIGIPSLRLTGLYLAITTLAFAVILNSLIVEGGDLTRGSEGISVPDLSIAGISFNSSFRFYYVCLVVAAFFVFVTRNLERSWFGRSLMALREYETAAVVSGIAATRLKLTTFVVSSFYIGVSGALFAHFIRYLNVDNFSTHIGIEALAMIIAGGLGSFMGSILGVVFLTGLSEVLRTFISASDGFLAGIMSTGAVEIRGLIYGLGIILFLRWEPSGLLGLWRRATSRLNSSRGSSEGAT